jgi:fibro-slime domain-containing protein
MRGEIVMKISKILPSAVVLGMAAMAAQPAQAAYTFSGTVTYYSVTSDAGNASDFKNNNYTGPYGPYNNMVTSTLGTTGKPVLNPSFNSTTIVNVLPTGELAWWTPGQNNPTGSNNTITVTQTGTAVVDHFDDATFFAPNGGGANNSTAFLTAAFSGILNLSEASTVSFSLGSDDDAFLYVNGELVQQLGGIHAPTPVNVTTQVLNAGNNTVQLFYADRNKNQAELHFSLTAIGNSPVPEPATWAMMIGGLGLVGVAMRRRKTSVSFA